jgi:hypothetical protein
MRRAESNRDTPIEGRITHIHAVLAHHLGSLTPVAHDMTDAELVSALRLGLSLCSPSMNWEWRSTA